MSLALQRQIDLLKLEIKKVEKRINSAEKRIGEQDLIIHFFTKELEVKLSKAVETVIGQGLEVETQVPVDTQIRELLKDDA